MLTEPTSEQQQASDFIGAAISLTMKYPEQQPARQAKPSSRPQSPIQRAETSGGTGTLEYRYHLDIYRAPSAVAARASPT
jgi:hypothetical protein